MSWSGEDAVKYAGEKYLPRLESQTDDEYNAYRARAAFFNASARTAEGFVGLVCRRPPFIKMPDKSSAIGRALGEFNNDADMLGTTLGGYGQAIVSEIIAVGRAGTLVDWEGEVEHRVYVSRYAAEDILNWRTERINGRNLLTMVVLRETRAAPATGGKDSFEAKTIDQIRVLKLVAGKGSGLGSKNRKAYHCQVEIWQLVPQGRQTGQKRAAKEEWRLVETRIPLRRGKPLPLIPFVFHGPRHSLPDVWKLPLGDIIFVNLDHYRLDADYKHGMHFTALPTAWVSGFDKSASLRIGSSTAWVTETPGATAGFLEFTGQGLTTFERAMDRDERLMAVLGARMLEGQKKLGETAQAIELRHSGENSILSNLAMSASDVADASAPLGLLVEFDGRFAGPCHQRFCGHGVEHGFRHHGHDGSGINGGGGCVAKGCNQPGHDAAPVPQRRNPAGRQNNGRGSRFDCKGETVRDRSGGDGWKSEPPYVGSDQQTDDQQPTHVGCYGRELIYGTEIQISNRRTRFRLRCKSLYVERDGAWMLDADGAADKTKLDEFRSTNVTLMKERDELKTRLRALIPMKSASSPRKRKAWRSSNGSKPVSSTRCWRRGSRRQGRNGKSNFRR